MKDEWFIKWLIHYVFKFVGSKICVWLGGLVWGNVFYKYDLCYESHIIASLLW